jgi:GTP pyrophosphokinase
MFGIIHSLWPPKPRRVKDYIATPKTNYYQSLHTTVYGFNGRMTEFQIRTREMDDRAKYGVAAHWYYKKKHEEPKSWLNQLLTKNTQQISDLTIEAKNQPYNILNKIFVYTPKQEIISLPLSATPIDFAYLIHSELGNHCVGAEVNGKMVPLNHQLKDGDCVKIISQPHQTKPPKEWLDFVKTDLAKRIIKKFYEPSEN